LVEQLSRILDAHIDEDEPNDRTDQLDNIFIFSIIWSLGACLKLSSRKKFEDFLRKTCGRRFP
jgi:dynein heavy chain